MTAVTVAEKDPDDDITYALDFSDRLVEPIRRGFDYDVGAFRRATRDTGFYYECTTAGRTSGLAPRNGFPAVAEATVQDGSVTWTCKHPADAVLRSILSVEIAEIDDGVSATVTMDGFIAYVTVSGGTAGQDYDVTVRLTPSSGNPIDQTITVPVRAQ